MTSSPAPRARGEGGVQLGDLDRGQAVRPARGVREHRGAAPRPGALERGERRGRRGGGARGRRCRGGRRGDAGAAARARGGGAARRGGRERRGGGEMSHRAPNPRGANGASSATQGSGERTTPGGDEMTTQQPDSPTTTPARARYPRPIAIPTPLDVHQGRGLAASHSRAPPPPPGRGGASDVRPPAERERRRGCRRGARRARHRRRGARRPLSPSAHNPPPAPLTRTTPRPHASSPQAEHCSGRVWPAALTLLDHLRRPRGDLARLPAAARVLELGAGTGWMALRASADLERGAVWVATETSASGAVDRLDANLAAFATAAAARASPKTHAHPAASSRAPRLWTGTTSNEAPSRASRGISSWDPTSRTPPRARRRSRDASRVSRRRPTR